jgi:hypothetical protein
LVAAVLHERLVLVPEQVPVLVALRAPVLLQQQVQAQARPSPFLVLAQVLPRPPRELLLVQ